MTKEQILEAIMEPYREDKVDGVTISVTQRHISPEKLAAFLADLLTSK